MLIISIPLNLNRFDAKFYPKQMSSIYYDTDANLGIFRYKMYSPCFKNCSVSEEKGIGWSGWKECMV